MKQLVGRPGVLATDAANEGAILDPCHVTGIGATEEAVGALLFGEPDKGAALDHFIAQAVVLLGGTVTPVNRIGLAQLGGLFDPLEKFQVSCVLRRIDWDRLHND